MAFNLNNLLSTLDSSIGLLDSSSDLLSILQAINVTNPTMGHGKSQKKTYATRASLPAASVSLRGSLAVVQVIGNWAASGNVDNGLYVCTGNDWALVQGLDSAGTPPPFQGSNYGFSAGGGNNIIDKFSFTSDGNATDVGDLTSTTYLAAGQSSSTHGYATESALSINKFSFTSNANATDVGNLSYTASSPGGGQSSTTHGYVAGGWAMDNYINKFPFASDGDATDVGDLVVGRARLAGQSDPVNAFGYVTGGANSPSASKDEIDKFSFTSDGNATDVGDLTIARMYMSGQSSTTHGYTSGGAVPGGYASDYRDRIDKFSFTSGGSATDVGNLLAAKFAGSAGQSSTVSGYTSGGDPATYQIEKFPFASDGNSTAVGDLTANRNYPSGTQY